MKRILLILSVLLATAHFAAAQQEMDDLRRQMQDLQERMNQMMERFSQDFGGKFFLDTAYVKGFDGHSFRFDTSIVREFRMDGDAFSFPFDSSMMRGFRWQGFGPEGDFRIEMDTLFLRDFRGFGPDDGAGNFDFFSDDLSRELNQMMERLMDNFRQFDGEYFRFDGDAEEFRRRDAPPAEKEEKTPPGKKRKTTIL